jgi:hypothetical protein
MYALNSVFFGNGVLAIMALAFFPIVYLVTKIEFKAKKRMPAWVFYLFYPAHLLIIKVIVDL